MVGFELEVCAIVSLGDDLEVSSVARLGGVSPLIVFAVKSDAGISLLPTACKRIKTSGCEH